MKVIITKFLPPTTHKGQRISVKLYWTRPKIYAWDYALDVQANHLEAAKRFMYDLGQGDVLAEVQLIEGELNPSTYIYTIVANKE